MIEMLNKDLNEMGKEVKMERIKNENEITVLFSGIPGLGKSTLSDILLSNRKLMNIEGVGKRVIVNDEGVFTGNESVTRDPEIDSSDLELIFCDCPGFEDTNGFSQEIINSFTIDCLLSNKNLRVN